MRVLMFGWEFPPNSRGGLGTACYGLTKSLSKQGVDIVFVLPKGGSSSNHVSMITAEKLYIDNQRIKMKYVDSLLVPYQTTHEYDQAYRKLFCGGGGSGDLYGKNLFEEVEKYALKAGIIAQFEDHDMIHCHDWMTFKAGINAKASSGKPLIVHVHSTDFDRTGGHPNQAVYNIEREGMEKADRIVAVSNYTKEMIINHYGIPPDKVDVVHNGVEKKRKNRKVCKISDDDKLVLFLGRLTLQKGPEYFIEAAKKVTEILPETKFVVAGSGEMYAKMVNRAAELGLGRNMMFTGHLTGEDIDRAYQLADLYVMPSVSEPFGITPLESLKNSTPVLISKQSGVSEVLPNALKVDFWDIDEMTNQIVSTLCYSSLNRSLVENGQKDIEKVTWDAAAGRVREVYAKVAK